MRFVRHIPAHLRLGIRVALGMVCLALLSMVGLLLLWGIGLVAYFHLARPKTPVVDDGDLRLVEPAVSDDENAVEPVMPDEAVAFTKKLQYGDSGKLVKQLQ